MYHTNIIREYHIIIVKDTHLDNPLSINTLLFTHSNDSCATTSRTIYSLHKLTLRLFKGSICQVSSIL